MSQEQQDFGQEQETVRPRPKVIRRKLKRETIPVFLEDEQGQVRGYVLQELDGSGRDAYMNDTAGRMRIGPDGRPQGIKNFNGLQASLIHRSLFEAELEEQGDEIIIKSIGKQVDIKVISSWPSGTQQELFDAAQQLSGLGKNAQQEAKND